MDYSLLVGIHNIDRRWWRVVGASGAATAAPRQLFYALPLIFFLLCQSPGEPEDHGLLAVGGDPQH